MSPESPDTADVPRTPEVADALAPLAPAAHPIKLDAVIHERFRLAIMCALAAHARLEFIEITRHLGMTYGNLHIHAKRLEEVGYLHSVKQGVRRERRTTFAITRAGRKALERYFEQMESVIAAVRRAPVQHSGSD